MHDIQIDGSINSEDRTSNDSLYEVGMY